MKKLPFVSIIIVNHNGLKFLKECFESLYAVDYPRNKLEVIMVDNSSQDKSVEFVRKNYPQIKVILNEDNNYCKANNLGFKNSYGEYIVFLNNDTRVEKDWLKELVKVIENDPHIGAVGSKILFMDGRIQSIGHQEYPNFYWGDRGFLEKDNGQYDFIQEVPSICGACVLYRRKCLEDIGLFDEDFVMFVEDVDMAIRCRDKGWKLVIVPSSIIHHYYHGTAITEEVSRYYVERNRLLLVAKHYPDKLPQALSGREYFIRGGQKLEKDFLNILSTVLVKLFKESDKDKFSQLLPEIFKEIHRIFNLAKDNVVQTLAKVKKEVEHRNSELDKKNEEIKKLNVQISQKEIVLLNLGKEMSLYREKKQHLEEVNKLLKEEGEHFKVLNSTLNEMIKEQKLEIEDLRTLSLKKEKEIEELKILNSEITQKIKELKERAESLNEAIEVLRKENDFKDSKLKELEKINFQQLHLIKELNENVGSLYNELQGVYNSTGFRFILKPLWTILWPLKQFVKKLKDKIGDVFSVLFLPWRLFPKIKNSLKIKFQKDDWSKVYFQHISRKVFAPLPYQMRVMMNSYGDSDGLEKQLPSEEILRAINQASVLGVKEVQLAGCNPLRHQGFWKIVDFISKLEMKSTVVVDIPSVLTQLSDLSESPLEGIIIWLDEGVKSFADYYSGKREEILSSIKFLAEHKKNLSLDYAVARNLDNLEILKDILASNIPICFNPLVNNSEIFKDRKNFKKYIDWIKEVKSREVISSFEYSYLKVLPRFLKSGKYRMRCLGLSYYFCLDVEGDILPCFARKDLKLGNIFSDELDVIWYSEEAWNIRVRIFKEGCSKCWNSDVLNFQKKTSLSFLSRYG